MEIVGVLWTGQTSNTQTAAYGQEIPSTQIAKSDFYIKNIWRQFAVLT